MREIRSEKRRGKKMQGQDKAGGFADDKQKKQAKENLKARIKRGKNTVRAVKRSLLKGDR